VVQRWGQAHRVADSISAWRNFRGSGEWRRCRRLPQRTRYAARLWDITLTSGRSLTFNPDSFSTEIGFGSRREATRHRLGNKRSFDYSWETLCSISDDPEFTAAALNDS
jgi:hypothetical protein